MTSNPAPITGDVPAICAPTTDALEYLLVVLQTKLCRLRGALQAAPIPDRDTRPIIDRIDETERLITDATEFLSLIRREFDSLQQQVPS